MDQGLKHKVARGRILKLLAPEHPEHIDEQMLRYALDKTGLLVSSKALRSYAAYLKERGYVDAPLKGKKGKDFMSVAITAKGLDLLNGDFHDDGVEVD